MYIHTHTHIPKHIYVCINILLCEEVWNIIINNFIFVHNSELCGNDCGDGVVKKYVPIYNNIKFARTKYSVQQANPSDVFLYASLAKKRQRRVPSWKARRSRTLDILLTQYGMYQLKQNVYERISGWKKYISG